ncbi:prolyl oligopeptidase family serine peptidase [Solwaraspora sp. WMMD1047]|uniref:alpha/beta hydrolase family protein n=1 Tax=Solwaraspora sp. WMMD1047 TaxID=3016102 RepID=UPI002417D9C7|nr:alpha/beta fold hydrolase [Solwaraspora sp. WMMD1047]MDG4830827.1 prolyl oligopeptidase family serine peptidase [Solwaraspora sp. WMMD1047]
MHQQHGRYRLTPLSVPRAAQRCPQRTVEVGDADGTCQIFTRDVVSGHRRQATTAPHGVDQCEIEPDGAYLWWFDADPDGVGRWRRQPFSGGPVRPVLAGLPAGRMYGTGLADPTDAAPTAAIGLGIAGESRCYLGEPGGTGRLVWSAPGYQALIDLAPRADLLVLAGAPGGRDAVTVVAAQTGRPVARIAGDPRRPIWPMEFRPDPDAEPELLLIVADRGRYTLATWRPAAGLRVHDWLPFQSEISAQWYGPDRTVLVQQDWAGRSRLRTVRLDSGAVDPVPTPPGTITDTYAAPGGPLRCVWSRIGQPPRILTLPTTTTGSATQPVRPVPAGAPDVRAARDRDLSTSRGYGQIHSFLTTPPGPGPWPTLFLVHGGPASHDRDCYDPRVELLVDAGFAVVRTNYRGSTGYGAGWRRIDPDRVGLAQLDDLVAVRAQLVRAGVAEPGRIGLMGHSWGGYLTLLGLGATPHLWDVGLAGAPVADYPAAYRTGTPALREVDRELFGGTPDEVPDRYRTASPLTYVDDVRAPVLIAAAPDDPKCPWTQVERYADALRRRGARYRLLRTGGGHASRDAADHVAVLIAMRDFARAVFGGATTSVSGADGPRAPRRAGIEVTDAPARQPATSLLPGPAQPAGAR